MSLLEDELNRLWGSSALHSAAASALTYPHEVRPAQVRNLLFLAMYMAGLPDTYSQFEMDWYRSVEGTEGTPAEDQQDIERGALPCGTSACAAGHGPVATRVQRFVGESWEEYIERTFGNLPSNYGRFLFSAWWSETDNTPRGAAARIVHLLRLASMPLCELPREFTIPVDRSEREPAYAQYAYLLK